MIIKPLSPDNLTTNMLLDFNHTQHIKQKYIKKENEWILTPVDIVRQWDLEKRQWIPEYLAEQIERGGFALGAFEDETLVGFCCIDGYLCGQTANYRNLTMLFVDDNFQRKGIGRKLFQQACSIALQKGAEKLFISAIPSVDTISFYLSMGCQDAKEIIESYVDTEEDRYLEYILNC